MADIVDPEVISPVKRTGRPKGRKNSKAVVQVKQTAKVLELRARGLSQSEIAGAVGLSETRVKQLVQQFKPVFRELENIEKYQQVRKDLLTATELQLLKSLNDPEKLDKASLNNVAYSFSAVHSARRLEAGLSTSNASVQQISVTLHPALEGDR